ncbi:WXG100 family type VII secretion target [Microbacterium sp. Clip185]|uniref:WXG100 family type VII secretion target n=1 Tax=Microbacterium sp. Clip185 TaxID=3025663 RepID=UPI002365E38C|nr:hypothetical protein [Microbacterium sp. Clip185]WDG18189.1 hypothetical protein PQV94_00280 [Microbacterium sp. Clip185]
MTAHWSELDPGACDPSAFAAANGWFETQLIDLTNALDTVSAIRSNLDDLWTGQSAAAFKERLSDFNARLIDSVEAIRTGAKAIAVYGDAVSEIARRAEPLKEDLAVARATLHGLLNVGFNAAPGSRFNAEQQALNDASAAASSLAKLAAERAAADQTVAVALASASSISWGDLDCTVAPTVGTQRDAANRRVMDLFEHFRTGDERGAVLTDDDVFVQTLMRSDHIEAVRERALDDYRNGRLTAQDPGFYDRSISDQPWVLVNDAVNVLSSTMTGTLPAAVLGSENLPESFLGSYSLEVRVGEPRSDGGVEMTYVINNDTSIDSATRIPGTGGAHLPGMFEAMSVANAENGTWATHHQTIVWTETVYP